MRSILRVLCTGGLVLVCGSSQAALHASAAPSQTATSRESLPRLNGPDPVLLLTIPTHHEEPDGGWQITCPPQLAKCAYIARKGEGVVAVFDGREGPSYDEIQEVAFNPSFTKIAYKARKGKSWVAVVDDKEGSRFDDIRELQFVDDHLCYQGATGNPRSSHADATLWRLVLGDHTSDGFNAITLAFSADRSSYAYTGLNFLPSGILRTVVLNGRKVGEFSDVSVTSFTSDGRLVFAARNGPLGPSTLYVGGRLVAQHDEISDITTGPDGRSLAYVARTGPIGTGRSALVVNGKVVREAARIRSPVFLSDGISVAFVEQSPDGNMRSRAVIGGHYGPPSTFIGWIVISPDGKRHAYTVRSTTGAAVVVDGIVGPEFSEAYAPQFSPDSKRLAYLIGRNGAYHVSLDGILGPAFDQVPSGSIKWYGSGLVYRGIDDGEPEALVVNGETAQLNVTTIAEPVLSADLRRLTLITREGREIWRRTVMLPVARIDPIRTLSSTRTVRSPAWTQLRVAQTKNEFTFTAARQLAYKGKTLRGSQLSDSVNRVTISPAAGGRYAVAMPLDQGETGSALLLDLGRVTALRIALSSPPLLVTSWSPAARHLLLASYYESQFGLHVVTPVPSMSVRNLVRPEHNPDEEHHPDLAAARWESDDIVIIPVRVNCNPYGDRPCATDRSVVLRQYDLIVNVVTGRLTTSAPR